MYKLKIIVSMLGRGTVYGAGLGTLTGCAFSLPLFIFGGFIGILIGLGIGLGIGAITGLVVGIVTILFFYPLQNGRRYKWSITLICAALSAILAPVIFYWFWFGHLTLRLDFTWILFAFVAMIAALSFSKWLTRWYLNEHALNQTHINTSIKTANDSPL